MKITTSQLRKIIKEEISVIRKNYINESLQSKEEALTNAMQDFLNEFPADEKDYACKKLMHLAQGVCDLLNEESIETWVDSASKEELINAYHDLTGAVYGRSSSIVPDNIEELKTEIILLQREAEEKHK